jgi:hypothetical protein
MPYMSCPSCGLTHYETATAVVTKRSCPRCLRKLGIESILFESPTLTAARAALDRYALPERMIGGDAGQGAAPAA